MNLTSFPELIKQWHPTKNGDLKPEDFTHGSHKKIWWKCSVANDHEWEDTIYHRTHGRGCVCCSGHKTVLSNCLKTTHPKVAVEWHPMKNGDLKPEDFT